MGKLIQLRVLIIGLRGAGVEVCFFMCMDLRILRLLKTSSSPVQNM